MSTKERMRKSLLVLAVLVSALPARSVDVSQQRAEARIRVVHPNGEPLRGAEVFVLADATARARSLDELERDDLRPVPWQLVESHGVRARCDATGVARVALVTSEGSDQLVVAKAPGAYGFATLAAEAEELEVRCAPDRTLTVRVLDARGEPRADVEVAFATPLDLYLPPDVGDRVVLEDDPLDGIDGCRWVGVSDRDGLVRIEHAQLRVEREHPSYVALGIPVAKRELVRVDLERASNTPIELRLPSTGQVWVEVPRAVTSAVRLRAAPGSPARSSWSRFAPSRRSPRDGRAEFAFVELGLTLEAELAWPGLPEPLIVRGPGPTVPGATATLRIDAPSWFGGEGVEPRLVVLDRGREVPVRWVALTAIDNENREFELCFERVEEPGAAPDAGRVLQPVLGTWLPSVGGEHRSDTGGRHQCALVAASDVERVGAAAGLTPARFVGRDVRLSASLVRSVATGQRPRGLPLELVVRNDGQTQVSWWSGATPLGLDLHAALAYRVTRDDASLSPRSDLNVRVEPLAVLHELAPGATFVERDDLATWFDVKERGHYRVEVEHYVIVLAPPTEFSSPHVCTAAFGGCAQILRAALEFEVER